eukprot:TRINITY_DN78547_c0_g1_i1.p1 TRINITY_DN78547_c0_g1~~TRINITY_DN78547_c0_g1_i1.p1  ORF type:complete len:124 (+),score=7.50 TRINITY_DN78547_c0_g1_i1:54-425(+)
MSVQSEAACDICNSSYQWFSPYFLLSIVIPLCTTSDDEVVGWSRPARPAYLEPWHDEEKKRKAEQERCRFFWQDAYKPPTVVEYTCPTCSYILELDRKWWKPSKGGLNAAICPRCRTVVAGVK